MDTMAKPLSQTAYWGAYVPPSPYPDCSTHLYLERVLQSRLRTMSWFQTWNAGFPSAAATIPRDYELLIAWEPVLSGNVPVTFADILAGDYDEYIDDYFTDALAWTAINSQPVTVRFCHEMNLGKRFWSLGRGCTDTMTEWRDTWRYVYGRMKGVIGDSLKVQMLFCTATYEPPGSPSMEDYWPGGDWVDKTGFDAYSGVTDAGWTEPAKLLQPTYTRLLALGPAKPIWLCEVGCRQPSPDESVATGRDKGRWLDDLFNLTAFPRLTHVAFFNRTREQDWRLESSTSSLVAAQIQLFLRAPGH